MAQALSAEEFERMQVGAGGARGAVRGGLWDGCDPLLLPIHP